MTTSISESDKQVFLALQADTSIMGGLSDAQVSTLLDLMDTVSFADGQSVFYSGDPASAIYIVLRGNVRLDFGEDGHPLSQIEFKPGDCFGETSVIGIQPHSASAIAKGEITLFRLSTSALFALYETDTKLFAMIIMNVAREASRRLHHTDSLFLAYTQTSRLQSVQ